MQSFSESLNSQLKWDWERLDARKGTATIADDWVVELVRYNAGAHYNLDVSFAHFQTHSTPTKQHSATIALQIYATVGSIIDQYIEMFPVGEIIFAAAQPKMVPIYQRLADKIGKKLNAEVVYSRFHKAWSIRIPEPSAPAQ